MPLERRSASTVRAALPDEIISDLLSADMALAGARIAKAWQTLTIGTADVDIAGLLKIPLNAPVAKVDRVAIDKDGVVLYAGHGVYRGDSISMEIELR